MGKSLVIVESPAKAKTINKYLGNDFKVMASMGHVRDLPTNKLGVNLENSFEPSYIVMPSKRKVITELKSAAKSADAVYLAPDPDREGEAICWHLKESVIPEGKPVYRVMFNEITKRAVQDSISNPGLLNMNRVDAQQARRILDRLVGYLISPVLWKKVKRGISAGRVQSVALRMIVNREYEILAFNKEEYWTFLAQLEGSQKPIFKARLIQWKAQNLRQGNKEAALTIATEADAKAIEAHLKQSTFRINSIQRKARRQNSPPPFTTSKLQQDASRSLGFTVKKTMMVAQKLYEGVEVQGETTGLITYMRTDSTRVSNDAIADVRDFIGKNYEPSYLPKNPRIVKQKNNIQDGHEAIRPTRTHLTPKSLEAILSRDEFRLYSLIWKRFVASQMTAKQMDETVMQIAAGDGLLEAKGLVTTFPGYTCLYQSASSDQKREGDDRDLPNLQEGEVLDLRKLETDQNFTKPPARFTEASLVKALEENGIGRPSTYAAIIATIQNRDYVEKRDNRFHPSELGMVVTNLLTQSFPELMDLKYTARMENELDNVETGNRTWVDLMTRFYESFEADLKRAEDHMPNMKRDGLPTDLSCKECGKPLVIKTGKYGQFLSCSNYPECTYALKIRDLDPDDTELEILKSMASKEREANKKLEEPCPLCTSPLVRRRGKYGEFTACSNYPACRYIHKELIGVKCPKPNCDGDIQVRKSRKGKVFYGCTNYPKCDFVSWDKPLGNPCPIKCGAATLYEKKRKKETIHYCQNQECKYSEVVDGEQVEVSG